MRLFTRWHEARGFAGLARSLAEAARRGAAESALLAALRGRLDGLRAARMLRWLTAHQPEAPLPVIRAVQVLALTACPITTHPNPTDYEWAGPTLKRLLKTDRPVAELWPFFSGERRSAVIAQTDPRAGAVTMRELTAQAPEVLGPAGADPEHGHQKYFFVKFLDPSDFPAFAYVGLHPEAVDALGKDSQTLKAHVADLLWQERQALEDLAALIKPAIATVTQFDALKTAYKQWAIAQADANWSADARADLTPFIRADHASRAQSLMDRQQAIRRQLAGLMHRIDFTDDQAILIESPTLHAIAGLSLQLHPRQPDNFHPKDELWIYKPILDTQGQRLGWVLVEPQRTFDVTESGADFFTPFTWRDGRLDFRKTLPRGFRSWQDYLAYFVSIMDAMPRPRSHYLRAAQPIALPASLTQGGAQWSRVVEEPGWPYFLVRELRFGGAGASRQALEHHCFIELHATHGQVDITLRRGTSSVTCTVSPRQPVFLPASLPYDTIEYSARSPAQLLFFTRPTPTS